MEVYMSLVYDPYTFGEEIWFCQLYADKADAKAAARSYIRKHFKGKEEKPNWAVYKKKIR